MDVAQICKHVNQTCILDARESRRGLKGLQINLPWPKTLFATILQLLLVDFKDRNIFFIAVFVRKNVKVSDNIFFGFLKT